MYPVIDSGIRPRKVDCHLDAGIRASHWHVVIRSHYWTLISESRLSSKFISTWVSAAKNTRFPIVFWLLFLFFIWNDIFWFQSISDYFFCGCHTHQVINSILIVFYFFVFFKLEWYILTLNIFSEVLFRNCTINNRIDNLVCVYIQDKLILNYIIKILNIILNI